jgi:hypothetical protein
VKIIAKTKDGWVLEATEQEVANLAGKYSIYNERFAEIGVEFPIHEMYEFVTNIKAHIREVAKFQERLLQCATLLDLPKPMKTEE